MDIHQEALIYAKEIFENESGGHDFHHTLRVYKTAMRLSKSEAAEDAVIALAAIRNIDRQSERNHRNDVVQRGR
jgi:HD superfamily phosphodiesterase